MTQVETHRPATLHGRSTHPTPGSPTGRATWTWCALALSLLIGSGVVRSVQADRYEQEQNVEVRSPFPLGQIPRSFGDWKVVEGSETVLDPLTTRITGSTDHIIRTYSDQLTGVALSVLILYGPAEPVLPHNPQICYPASGFRSVGDTIDRGIEVAPGRDASFRSAVFGKSGGRLMIQQAVYHSYLYDGTWSPSINDRKIPRHKSGIFKVQIQRRVAEGESRGNDEPIESFIKALVPVIESMIRAADAAPVGSPPVGSPPITPP